MQEIIKEFADKVRKEHKSQIEHVFLFGSYSRGDEREDSDIDILVVWKGDKQEGWERIGEIAYDFLLKKGKYISIKVITLREKKKMEKMHNPFINSVHKEGIVLV